MRNAHNLYQLLGRELQYNRDAAATLWAEIAGEEMRATADDTSAMDRAYRLSEWYMPTWSFVFWRSHAAQVADTLSEDQVYQVLEIQSQLELANNIHVRLARLRANFDTYIQHPPPNMDSQQLERAKREAAHLLEHQMITEYHEFERVIQSLLAGDSPLVEDRWCEAATPTGPHATR